MPSVPLDYSGPKTPRRRPFRKGPASIGIAAITFATVFAMAAFMTVQYYESPPGWLPPTIGTIGIASCIWGLGLAATGLLEAGRADAACIFGLIANLAVPFWSVVFFTL